MGMNSWVLVFKLNGRRMRENDLVIILAFDAVNLVIGQKIVLITEVDMMMTEAMVVVETTAMIEEVMTGIVVTLTEVEIVDTTETALTEEIGTMTEETVTMIVGTVMTTEGNDMMTAEIAMMIAETVMRSEEETDTRTAEMIVIDTIEETDMTDLVETDTILTLEDLHLQVLVIHPHTKDCFVFPYFPCRSRIKFICPRDRKSVV